ncbi:hypothetical protein J1N10_13640 [Carboxylicivirga sp. A043]|uniref:DUF5362 family protein n=1 Tax=Carboxylicivirga litoralis TaxID=2816963 RepID=UPI0021CB7CF3|nr:DUF5362 family protein [Carboxylicivirga sp. A043]MCU4157027.1 hypothetical protein [Carboxylicivirga sp. A043]
MEEQNIPTSIEEQAEKQLTISESAAGYLLETSKWAKFLSIMGFIFIGFIVIMGLFAGSLMSIFSGGHAMGAFPAGIGFIFSGVYILLGLLYFFPTMYLFKFSQKTKVAVLTKNSDELSTALSNHKSFFKFWGIFTIVVISLYVVSAIFMVLFSAFLFNV